MYSPVVCDLEYFHPPLGVDCLECKMGRSTEEEFQGPVYSKRSLIRLISLSSWHFLNTRTMPGMLLSAVSRVLV